MHIYIDESGSFLVPKDKKSRVSCVAALVIPSSRRREVVKEFKRLRASWGSAEEVKGSKLDENQVAATISLLRGYDVLAEICAIEMGGHTEQQVSDYKRMQADKLVESVTPEHHPDVIREADQLRATVLGMSNQLFVQSFMMILLIDRLIEIVPLYYCQRARDDLGSFYWTIDAKDRDVTKSEQWWSTVMMPMIQTRSMSRPSYDVEEFDYGYFDRFRVTLDKAPDLFREAVEDPEAPFTAIDFKLLMQEHFEFADSRTNLGLQLVDVIASATTRAFNGTLKEKGWRDLGSLIVRRTDQTVRMIRLNTDPQLTGKTIVERNHLGYVMEAMERRAKSLFL